MATATTDVAVPKLELPVIHASSDYLPKLKAKIEERERLKLLHAKLTPVQPSISNGTETLGSRVPIGNDTNQDGILPVPPLPKPADDVKPVPGNSPTQLKPKYPKTDNKLPEDAGDEEASNFIDSIWDKMKAQLGLTTDCLNGGTKRSSDKCICPQYFSGPKCEKRQCINNGTLVSLKNHAEDFCRCPHPQYITGDHCEIVKCMNGGRFIDGSCVCVENWYTGRYCENYAASWFAVLGIPLIIIAVFAFCCVICRLDFCPKRGSSSRSGSRRNRLPHSDHPSSSSQNSRRVEHRCVIHDERLVPLASHGRPNPRAELANYQDFNPALPPNDSAELKPNEPPPTYEQAINGDSIPVPPDVAANFAHISSLSVGPPPPVYTETEEPPSAPPSGPPGLPS